MSTEQNSEHRDRLGRLIKIGDCVAFPEHNFLSIGKVLKLNPKMVKVKPLGKRSNTKNKYPEDCVLLDGPEVVMYLIKNS